jgi:hypothetical protein
VVQETPRTDKVAAAARTVVFNVTTSFDIPSIRLSMLAPASVKVTFIGNELLIGINHEPMNNAAVTPP